MSRSKENSSTRIKPSSRIALIVAKYLPRGYWPLLKAAASRDIFLQDYPIALKGIPGYAVRADFRENVYVPLLRNGHIPHQTGLDNFCRQAVAPGDIAVDVGANIGFTAMLLSSLVGGTGHVYAFEPGRRIFALLQRNVAGVSNIHPINMAIGAAPGTAEFNEAEFSDVSSLIPIEGSNSYLVKVTCLDSFFQNTPVPPRFVKIDVEGFEPSVFRGMQQMLLAEMPPILAFEALSAERLKSCLSEIPLKLKSNSTCYRIGSRRLSRDLDNSGLSCDYALIPNWASDRFVDITD